MVNPNTEGKGQLLCPVAAAEGVLVWEREKRFPRRKGHLREGGPSRRYWAWETRLHCLAGRTHGDAPVAAEDTSVQGREEPRTL